MTGGAGFLGSNLCRELLKIGHEVLCLDNLSTGRISNVMDLKKFNGFEFIEYDVKDYLDFQVNGVFNLASPASPMYYQKDPVETLRTNVVGAFQVLDLAYRKNLKVLQASTSEVYGDPLENPQTET